jgi:hypothetical protein
MSCIENDKLIDRLKEKYYIWADDYDTRNMLAERFLEGVDYYSYCKDDNQDLLHSYLDELYCEIEDEFFNNEQDCFDIGFLYEQTLKQKGE